MLTVVATALAGVALVACAPAAEPTRTPAPTPPPAERTTGQGERLDPERRSPLPDARGFDVVALGEDGEVVVHHVGDR
ncbi:hypothetical protein DT076_10345 [Desertihabitans brevis]|uniref:Uncharacterized protein n=2 Tax=Desertihabitans brevis TaxID=2268447 RepID=A0A367YTS0_9ACTN|nr:hypothetical protein DT076_10345 [Desertihabitans brevis]